MLLSSRIYFSSNFIVMLFTYEFINRVTERTGDRSPSAMESSNIRGLKTILLTLKTVIQSISGEHQVIVIGYIRAG